MTSRFCSDRNMSRLLVRLVKFSEFVLWHKRDKNHQPRAYCCNVLLPLKIAATIYAVYKCDVNVYISKETNAPPSKKKMELCNLSGHVVAVKCIPYCTQVETSVRSETSQGL